MQHGSPAVSVPLRLNARISLFRARFLESLRASLREMSTAIVVIGCMRRDRVQVVLIETPLAAVSVISCVPPHSCIKKMPTTLPILHFNDVYRVNPQKLSGGTTIDVTQFASMLDALRDGWSTRPDGARDGLVLFSGDLFAPSVESSVTRGSHMVSASAVRLDRGGEDDADAFMKVPVINALAPDVAVTGVFHTNSLTLNIIT